MAWRNAKRRRNRHVIRRVRTERHPDLWKVECVSSVSDELGHEGDIPIIMENMSNNQDLSTSRRFF